MIDECHRLYLENPDVIQTRRCERCPVEQDRPESNTDEQESSHDEASGIPNLLMRNLRHVFRENDPMRRRAAIDEIFHEGAVFYDPKGGIFRGRRSTALLV